MFGYTMINTTELERLQEFEKQLKYLVDRFGCDGPAVCDWGAKTLTGKEWADAVYHAACDMSDYELKCQMYKLQPNKYVLLYIYNPNINRILVLEKNRPVEQKGKINLIGGKVNPGESYKDAAIRECFEETGLTIDNFIIQGYIKGRDFSSQGDKDFCIAVYSGYTYEKDIKPVEGETEKPFWMSHSELMNLPKEKTLNHFKDTISEINFRILTCNDILPFIILEHESIL